MEYLRTMIVVTGAAGFIGSVLAVRLLEADYRQLVLVDDFSVEAKQRNHEHLPVTAKVDLTRMGSLLFMGLIGIILASVVNWFMKSGPLDFLISIGGVLVFTGLVAYDTQRLKRIAAGVEYGSVAPMKLALLGATSLYLDFLNLFLFLLRLLGRRD